MHSVLRLVRKRRRLVIAALVFVAAWIALTSLRATPETETVLAAAHDLPAGTILAEGDVVSISFPRDVLSGAEVNGTQQALGRTLLTPMRAHELITTTRLLEARDVPAGYVLLAIRLDAQQIRFIRTGDHIDLIGVVQGQGRVLVRAARVVVATSGATDSGLLVEVPENTAPALAAASTDGSLSATLLGNEGG